MQRRLVDREKPKPEPSNFVVVSATGGDALDARAVRRALGRVLGCAVRVVTSSAAAASPSVVLCELPDAAAAERALGADYRVGEVLGVAVDVAAHRPRRSRAAEVAAAFAAADAEDAAAAERKRRRGRFVRLPAPQDSDAVEVAEACTVCARRCPATLGSEDGVRALFGECGAVRSVVLRHDASGAFAHTAFVEFADRAAAEAAVSRLNRRFVDGARIRVEPYVDPVAAFQKPAPPLKQARKSP